MPLLEVQGLTVTFGGLSALQDVSFSVETGSIHGLIGPNGAGKTTVFNCISRLVEPRSGQVRFRGQDLLKLPPHHLAGLGIARTYQNVELCRSLTVLENVMLGMHSRLGGSMFSYALRLPGARQIEDAAKERAMEILDTLKLTEAAEAPAGILPFGGLKVVEVGRALGVLLGPGPVTRQRRAPGTEGKLLTGLPDWGPMPKLLLLDEPAAGLNTGEREKLAGLVRWIRYQFGITILMVEHDMSLVMSLCDEVTVLDFGRRIAAGRPHQVQHDPAVVAAYLGEEGEEAALAQT